MVNEIDIVIKLANANQTLALAESCSGGLLSHRITNVPGSSSVLDFAICTYSNESKAKFLAMPMDVIEEHGAVSESVAKGMSEGVRQMFNSTYGVGITGIAGPGGGSAEKPVGMVHIAVSTDTTTIHEQCFFEGNREEIKKQSTDKALDMIFNFIN